MVKMVVQHPSHPWFPYHRKRTHVGKERRVMGGWNGNHTVVIKRERQNEVLGKADVSVSEGVILKIGCGMRKGRIINNNAK